MAYDANACREKQIHQVEEITASKKTGETIWINVDGLHETGLVENIGEYFNIHALMLEDILHTNTRAKIELFDKGLFFVFNLLYQDHATHQKILGEQLSVILGPDFLISFQERSNPLFKPLMDRIRNDKSRIRKKGADYLAYAIVDMVVDSYFIILENFEDKIEALEEELISSLSKKTFQSISDLKRNLISMRRAVTPLREIINVLGKNDSGLLHDENRIFFTDIHDHILQIQETIDIFREILSSLHETYLANVNNRTNEIMKTLTITATIFIPLTFIAGIYGMNFKYMPELEWEYGYFAVWALIISVVGVMFYFFKKKEWF